MWPRAVALLAALALAAPAATAAAATSAPAHAVEPTPAEATAAAADLVSGVAERASEIRTVLQRPVLNRKASLTDQEVESIAESSGELHDWIHAQGHEEGIGPWESYVDDPAKTDHATLRTEVVWPVS